MEGEKSKQTYPLCTDVKDKLAGQYDQHLTWIIITNLNPNISNVQGEESKQSHQLHTEVKREIGNSAFILLKYKWTVHILSKLPIYDE